MRHIIVLGAADTRSDQVPVWLLEHGGHTLIENIVGRCENLGAKIIFAMQKDIARKYHLDSIAKLASPSARLVEIDGLTQGAACTALLCVEEIDLDDELLIMSANEVLEMDLSVAIENFKSSGSDAGVITFASLHPRYSYVALGSDDRVIQAAEKHPISRKAIAGFFWFAKANEFVSAAQDMIRKDVKVDDQFFISLTLNELILKHKVVTTFEIEPAVYKPLKSDRQSELRDGLTMKHHRLDEMTKGWFVGAFSPTAVSTDSCEVAVKHYSAGDRETLHHHRIAMEITLIVSGEVRMQDRSWGPGDILVLAPGESTAFEAITDAVNVVVKLPSVAGDKYDGPFVRESVT